MVQRLLGPSKLTDEGRGYVALPEAGQFRQLADKAKEGKARQSKVKQGTS